MWETIIVTNTPISVSHLLISVPAVAAVNIIPSSQRREREARGECERQTEEAAQRRTFISM